MNDVLAEDALADGEKKEGATATLPPPPPDGEGLGGYNPSDGEEPPEVQADGGDEEETFPEDPDDTPAGPGEDEEEREPTSEAEEQTIVDETEPEAGAEPPAPAEEPEAQADPPAEPPPTRKPKSKSRVYFVFEEHGRGDPSYKRVSECLYTGAEQIKLKEANKDVKDYEVPTGELVSRNGDNALRAAYRRLAAAREDEDLKVTLVIVAQSSWRPKNLKPRQRNLPPAIEIN